MRPVLRGEEMQQCFSHSERAWLPFRGGHLLDSGPPLILGSGGRIGERSEVSLAGRNLPALLPGSDLMDEGPRDAFAGSGFQRIQSVASAPSMQGLPFLLSVPQSSQHLGGGVFSVHGGYPLQPHRLRRNAQRPSLPTSFTPDLLGASRLLGAQEPAQELGRGSSFLPSQPTPSPLPATSARR